MTTKQRAYLKGLAMNLEPIIQIGKSNVTPELTAAVSEALEELCLCLFMESGFVDNNKLPSHVCFLSCYLAYNPSFI